MEYLSLIWVHFLSDFVLQSDKMAKNKSSSNSWLGIHVLVYSIPFIFFGFWFAVVNGAIHFVVDWISSRCAKHFWESGEVHWFFVVVGFDQAVHITTLLITYDLMLK